MRSLAPVELTVDLALRRLVGDVGYLELTAIGLAKSILDATAPLRAYLGRTGLHDYTSQATGPSAKRILPCKILAPGQVHESSVSLYRPETKSGDPRLWISRLNNWADPGDILALFVADGLLYVLNLSRHDLDRQGGRGAAADQRPDLSLLARLGQRRDEPAARLLARLSSLAGQWLPSDGHGPTAVGRTLESALGIPINNLRAPDFEGIELKAKRVDSGQITTRTTLFAQVPDWAISPCGGSGQLLDRYGYTRAGIERLYCQINFGRVNGQGLRLSLDTDDQHLQVVAQLPDGHTEIACLWSMETLRRRLLEKHAETFWVFMREESLPSGNLGFRLVKAIHTRDPYVSRLEALIRQDAVTVDFLIKRLATGGAKDKGYLFKLRPGGLDDLFPQPREYLLEG